MQSTASSIKRQFGTCSHQIPPEHLNPTVMALYKILLVVMAVACSVLGFPGGHDDHMLDGGDSHGHGHAESYASFNLLSHGHGGGGHKHEEEHIILAHPKYDFKYGVEDKHTGDYKDQQEERDGDVVKGEYSLLQPDGRKRIVHYTASKHGGFNAIVSYSGHAIHPEVHHAHSVHGHGGY